MDLSVLTECCVFCEEAKTRVFEYQGKNYGSRILYETENFLVLPAVGQIKPEGGYLLINSKEHFLSMGGMPLSYFQELEEVMFKVKDVLSKYYEPPVFFEHGLADVEKKKVCCIAHAHIHAFPAHIDSVKAEVEPYSCEREITDLKELNLTFSRGISYLYFENNGGKKYLFDVNNIASQLLRQVVAEKTGNKDRWDWKMHPGIETMLSTIETLKGKF